MSVSDYEARFSGIQRLYGQDGLARLRLAHVCVVGIGGVGCWAVEALARSGMGELTLVDLDEVCVSNVNRQLHAVDGEFGREKVNVMADRIERINPECRLHPVPEFFTESSAAGILGRRFDYVLDAIDHVQNKCLLLLRCRALGIPFITTGGAGGRRNPLAIQVNDLSLAGQDRLLKAVNRSLRREHGFPRGDLPFGIDAVFSTERPVYASPDGGICDQRNSESDPRITCNSGYGTASFVTGAFGFAAASHVVQRIASGGKELI
jgi:tRNA A37 threonylcarbamoyladenosine dehydratase